MTPAEDRRHTLLIVDDEPGLLQALRLQFTRDYRVLTAEGGHPALDLLRKEDVHAILCDQRMPGLAGDALLAQARLLRPDAVRVLFTGYADIQSVIASVNSGLIYRYVLKPWDPLELEGIVRQSVEHHDLVVDRRRLAADLRDARDKLARADRDRGEADELKWALMETGRLRADLADLARRIADLEAGGPAGRPRPNGPDLAPNH